MLIRKSEILTQQIKEISIFCENSSLSKIQIHITKKMQLIGLVFSDLPTTCCNIDRPCDTGEGHCDTDDQCWGEYTCEHGCPGIILTPHVNYCIVKNFLLKSF